MKHCSIKAKKKKKEDIYFLYSKKKSGVNKRFAENKYIRKATVETTERLEHKMTRSTTEVYLGLSEHSNSSYYM